MCDFCKNFDFGSASFETDKYVSRILLSSGSYRFPEFQMFNYCPICGKSRTEVIFERERINNNDD